MTRHIASTDQTSGGKTVIRPFKPEDSEALTALWIEAWNATLPDIDFSQRQVWFTDWLATHRSSGGVVLCALHDAETVVGFAGFDPSTGHMEQIAVHPVASGRGVGRALLAAVKACCPNGVTLRVNQENPRAVDFYRRAGFVIVAEGVNTGGQRPIFDMAWKSG